MKTDLPEVKILKVEVMKVDSQSSAQVIRNLKVKVGDVLVDIVIALYCKPPDYKYRYVFKCSNKLLTSSPKWSRIREKIWKIHNSLTGPNQMAPYPEKKKRGNNKQS